MKIIYEDNKENKMNPRTYLNLNTVLLQDEV